MFLGEKLPHKTRSIPLGRRGKFFAELADFNQQVFKFNLTIT